MYGCDDGESGCNPSYSGGSKTFNTTTKTATIAEYVIKDKVGNSTTCAARTANVYVDKTAPSCTNSGDNYSWTNRDVTITYGCNDAESGCNASYSGGTKTFNTTTTTSKINSYTVKDKVGNSATCPARTANVYVDKTAPSCTNSGDNYSWTNRDVTITYGCLDSESGCNASYSGGTKTFNTTTMTSKINSYTIKDSAGNSKTCLARTASVYVDKTAPSITYFNVSSNDRYNSNNTTASLMGSDSHSGIDKVCLTLTNNSNTCAWIDVSNNYYSTDYKFASSNGSGDSHILYAFIKDKVGNISSVKSYYYRLYRTCDSTTQTLGGFTACSKVCGGGEQSQILNLTDRYFGTSCGTKQSGTDSCNTQDCCSSTYEVCGSALACSTTCGSGTASKFCETYSQYNGKFCKSYFKNTECNESYGCYVPSPDPIVPPTPDPVLPPTPDPVVPPTSCYLIAHCYKNVGDKYEIHLTVTGGCTLKSHFSTNCPHYDYSNTRFYVTAANGTTCQGVGAYFSNGVRASNNLRIHDGRGEYFSLTQYLPINKCTS